MGRSSSAELNDKILPTADNICPGQTFDIGRTFDIKGPNPTTDQRKHMREQMLGHGVQAELQAAAESGGFATEATRSFIERGQ